MMMIINDAISWSVTQLSTTLLALSIMPLERIYSTRATHGDRHLLHMFIVQATEGANTH